MGQGILGIAQQTALHPGDIHIPIDAHYSHVPGIIPNTGTHFRNAREPCRGRLLCLPLLGRVPFLLAGQAQGLASSYFYRAQSEITLENCYIPICEHSHPIEVDWSSRSPGYMGNWNPETNNVEKRIVSGAGTWCRNFHRRGRIEPCEASPRYHRFRNGSHVVATPRWSIPRPVSPLRGLSVFPPSSVGLLCCTHGDYTVGTPCLAIPWEGCDLRMVLHCRSGL